MPDQVAQSQAAPASPQPQPVQQSIQTAGSRPIGTPVQPMQPSQPAQSNSVSVQDPSQPIASSNPQPAVPSSPEAAEVAPKNGKHILLVDDDLTLSEMYGERLKASGYDVTVLHDGETGLEAAKKKPDLILLDIMMPKMNGLDVLKALKADPELRNIPVILLTALIQEIDKAKGIAGGAVDYYVKSEVMPGDLLKHIQQVLNPPKDK